MTKILNCCIIFCHVTFFMNKTHSHAHIKALFLGFFVFLFFVTTLELDPNMGKGLKAAEKFDEGGYMSFEGNLEGTIMLTSKESSDTLPMSEYQKVYIEKLQYILSNLDAAAQPTPKHLQQIVLYTSFLREKPCSTAEVEEGLCSPSKDKGGYLKEEIKMQQAYYANTAQGNTGEFYADMVARITGSEDSQIIKKSVFVTLLYKALYDKAEKPLMEIRTAFESKGIFLGEEMYKEGELSSKEVQEIVMNVLKGLLQNRKSSLQAQQIES